MPRCSVNLAEPHGGSHVRSFIMYARHVLNRRTLLADKKPVDWAQDCHAVLMPNLCSANSCAALRCMECLKTTLLLVRSPPSTCSFLAARLPSLPAMLCCNAWQTDTKPGISVCLTSVDFSGDVQCLPVFLGLRKGWAWLCTCLSSM